MHPLQEATHPSGERPADARLVEMRISLEARTQRGTRAVATTRTAALTDEDNPDHNPNPNPNPSEKKIKKPMIH